MRFKKGHVPTEETRKKLSESAKRRGVVPPSNLGKIFTDEHRDKIRQGNIGRVVSDETKKKISAALKGKPTGRRRENYRPTKEIIMKSVESRKGYRHSVETRSKMRETALRIGKKAPTMLGKKHSDEAKKKMSDAKKDIAKPSQKGRKHTEESRAKMSAAHKGKSATWNIGLKRTEEAKAKMRSKRALQVGPKCSAWKGGISFEPYNTDWTKTLKRIIRERDHYTCQLCSALQEETTHPVHHIDYEKNNCDTKNLITLCVSCHSKTNSNRIYWQAKLTTIMMLKGES